MNTSIATRESDRATRARQALQRLQSRLAELEARDSMRIAIVGIACRLPGNVTELSQLWSLLSEGGDAVTEIPAERWNNDAYFDPDPAAVGRSYARHGGFIRDIDLFDAGLFDISPREAEQLDPQQRILLEETWRALEDSGDLSPRLAGSRTGVFVGASTNDYSRKHIASGDPSCIDAHSLTGGTGSIASGRLAFAFGLEGPAITIDTACSSSLTAVHLACESLRQGTSDLAIAAGVNALLDPDLFVALSRTRALSPTGRCRAFDAAADGFVRSEGCVVIVLRRLSDAVERGDRIRAVIRGSALNNDGRSNGLTAPNGAAQRRLLLDALRASRTQPDELGFIEAHGTGTPLGDPIEFGALADVFGKREANVPALNVGSVKANLGHLEAAAGLAGLLKMVCCLEHGSIPRQLHLTKLNPHLPQGDARIVVPTEQVPWPTQYATRVGGVSSFGFSGTNAHVILEQAPVLVPSEPTKRPSLLCLSARSVTALQTLAVRYAEAIETQASSVADVCHTTNCGRQQHRVRAALVASEPEQLALQLRDVGTGKRRTGVASQLRVAFLIPGQGTDICELARELISSSPAFRDSLERLSRTIEALGEPPFEILTDPTAAMPRSARRVQPLLFAVQTSLAAMWGAWGVQPVAVIGHSLGEYAAACVAGVLQPDAALALVLERARLMDAHALPGGAMWAVQTSVETLEAVLAKHVDVSLAAHNGPSEFVIAGLEDSLVPALRDLSSKGARTRQLDVTHAFHSACMDPVLDEFQAFADKYAPGPARLAIYSTYTGGEVHEQFGSARYFRDQIRQPVRFHQAVSRAAEAGINAFVELGSAPVLTRLGRRSLGDEGIVWIGPGAAGNLQGALEGLAELFERGLPLDGASLARDQGPFRKVELPTYPFERRRFWLDRRPGAPSLGHEARPWFRLTALESPAISGRVYSTEFDVASMPIVADHRIGGDALVSLVVYLTLIHEALVSAGGDGAVTIEDFIIGRPLVLEPGQRHRVQLWQEENGRFRIASRGANAGSNGPWVTHVCGVLGPFEQFEAAESNRVNGRDNTQVIDPEVFYQTLLRRGFELGPACRGLLALQLSDAGLATGTLRDAGCKGRGEPDDVPLTSIDAAFQTLLLPRLDDDTPRVLVGFERLRTTGKWRRIASARASQTLTDGGTAMGALQMIDTQGHVVATCEGIRMKPYQVSDAVVSEHRATSRSVELPTSKLTDATAIEAALSDVVSQVLRLGPGELALDEPLTRLGVDSFMAMELAEHVERLTGLRVSLLNILGDASLSSLAADVASRVSSSSRASVTAAPVMEEGLI